ncbi:unnamed protein product [Thlaspi arvense]|uniref:Uncharacterized protein n=1 Tax=Thlaspi arvense TaxID=13288 RepID=A0AAU9T911_THLAR|nr:unnamed protein product [Thlaspi arvense]
MTQELILISMEITTASAGCGLLKYWERTAAVHQFLSLLGFSFFLPTYGGEEVYVIDYGLAKKYRDLQTHKHIPYKCQVQLDANW